MALGGMTQPFEEAEKVLEETGVSVSSKEIQLESEEVGQEVYRQVETEVESFWSGEKEIKPERTPIRVYITADGTTVRTEASHKEAKLGSVYETPVAQGALANDIQYTGGFSEAEDFGRPERWQHDFTNNFYMHPCIEDNAGILYPVPAKAGTKARWFYDSRIIMNSQLIGFLPSQE